MVSDSMLYSCSLPDEEYSISLFRKIRWADGVFCPKCHSFHVEKRGPQGRIHRYQCKNCGNNFNDFTNTIFHRSQVPIGIIFYILFNMNKTTTALAKETGHTRLTISRIKNMLKEK
ncbi:transposase [Methanobrevibacter filiformis]|uniref:Transposase zinc-ribbon domain protein n=1 Tax=Methanobrevibacter filiformis TaxID=55758 RepID=A0A166BSD9_9EURY|nr:transposase [Methanobrevibacter filiformis]KZX13762.1 transposase zinc-ribbon domain protein [Methanobrevibacter filiformis]